MAHVSVFIGLLELVAFFFVDFIYARSLNVHKNNHPELEECAPTGSPDLDTVAVLDSMAATAVQMVQHERQRFSGAVPAGNSGDYASLDALSPAAASGSGGLSSNPLHTAVVVCGAAAPLLVVLRLLFPSLMGWTTFGVPPWLSIVTVVPGLAVTGLYAARATTLSGLIDVTKSEWISMMWFRLDFLFIMSVVGLLGVGAWLVAVCMVSVAAYLAHRVMQMERRLSRIQRETQLVRGEVDVSRVLVPGTEESRKATGVSEGYTGM